MKNEFIGLLVEDTPSLLVGLLAILKSGNCIIPISPGFPVERMEFIVNDCRIKLLLTDKKNYPLAKQVFRYCSCLEHVICIEDLEFGGSYQDKSLPTVTDREDMEKSCYAIFTSGSTGKPKGVPITYSNLVPLLLWFHDYFRLGADIRVLQNLSYTFDFGMFELLTTLLAGGTLYFFNRKTLKDLNEYVDFIYLHQIDCIHTTPSFFNNIVGPGRKLSPLKLIHLGGEQLNRKLVEEIRQAVEENCYIYNGYGPTETTINTSIFSMQVKAEGRGEIPNNIPIGKPSANNIIYILDSERMLQPIGICGELYIGGSGVAAGYLNKPELTAEKFCFMRLGGLFLKKLSIRPSRCRAWTPYKNFLYTASPTQPLDHLIIYRTGDLGRWQSDGNIEFFGRIDHQVKIRGYRIELGEIENRLLTHQEIKECVVTVREGEKGSKYLCAYLVSRTVFNTGILREYLSTYLPDYMIPSYFVLMDKMPLTTSGKTDLRALPEPGFEAEIGNTAPRDEVEEKLACIWAEILGIEKGKIGIDSNFFELGGHSLKATLLTAMAHKEFQVKVPLVEIFKTPFIRGLAKIIKKAAPDKPISLEPIEKKEYYALSSAQKRIYVLRQMDEQGTGIAYNIPSVWTLTGIIDKDKFEEVFRLLILRHESLRTSFHTVKGTAVQRIHSYVEFEIEYHDAATENNLIKIFGSPEPFFQKGFWPPEAITKRFIRPFDLSRVPLMRVGLVELKGGYTDKENRQGETLLMVDMHHIIADGLSIEVFTREFLALYNGESLSPLKIQYKDYVRWQEKEKKAGAYLEQAKYWRKQIQEEIPILELPTDFARPQRQSFEGRRIGFGISPELLIGLKSLAREQETTLYMVLLAVFNVFLSKITNQETIVIGTAAAGRGHAQLEHILGMFVNTLVSINHPLSTMPFNRFLEDVKQRTLSDFENQDYPFEELVEHVTIRRNSNRNPLFDVLFDLQPVNINKIDIPGLKLESYAYNPDISKFDLMLQAVEEKDNLYFIFEYSTALFSEETIAGFIEYFKKILAVVLKWPTLGLSQIEIISEADKNRILCQFNNTSTPYPREKTVHRIFEEEVNKWPDKTAVAYEDQELSFSELDRLSGSFATYLRDRRINPEAPVGIMKEASLEVIVGVLGILKAGGAYMPIDPGYPEERKEFMLTDSNVKILLSDSKHTGAVPCPALVLNLTPRNVWDSQKRMGMEIVSVPAYSLATCNLPLSLAYIIYTSGSTGRPKGVMVEHRNIARLVKNTNFINFQADDRVMQTGALEFDASTFEIWGALLNGLTLYLTSKENILDTVKLKKLVIVNSITTMWFTSPLFNQVVQNDVSIFTGLRNVLVGGDVLSPVHIEQARRQNPGMRIINGYGPTENTTFSTTFLIDKEYQGKIPIGSPIANSTVYIVDKSDRLQPIGIVGELFVGGDGVSRGYLNNPELTCEKFLPGLYRFYESNICYRNSILYKTGDFARWLVDGVIEFLGRVDSQVKIRGFRIEPGEVENHLLKHELIKEALVLARKNEEGENYLCAYIVTRNREQDAESLSLTTDDKELDITALKKFLAGNLPDYMVPAYIIIMVQIPLTSNGKVNRRLLPKPKTTALRQTIAPRDEIEEKLVKIWSEVLNRDVLTVSAGISIDDDFFELGGHSIKAASLISKVHKIFNVNIPLTEIFTSPTVQEMAAYIKTTEKKQFIPIDPQEKKEYYPLSSAQGRLYVLHRMDEQGIGYNIPSVWNLEGDIDKIKLEEVFRGIIRRHESLRTSFEVINEEPVQRIHNDVRFELEYYDIAAKATAGTKEKLSVPKSQGLITTSYIKNFIRPFDLSRPPLLRVGLIVLTGKVLDADPVNRYRPAVLMVDMHHIISDGISMNIVMKDFMALFSARDLPALRIQYKDFSGWQRREQQKEAIKKQEEFWLKEFAGEIPVLDLPTDYTRPAMQRFEGSISSFEIPQDATLALKSLTVEMDTTLYMILLSLYIIFLSKVANQEDIIVGTPIAGRRHTDLEGVIGMFVNTLALRNYPLGEKTFTQFLHEVKEKTLNAFENQEYPYENLVDKVAVNRDVSRNPLFDTMFILQNIDMVDMAIFDLKISPNSYDFKISKFDLKLSAAETENKLLLTFEFSTKLFTEATIERFIAYFKKIISIVLIKTPKNIKLSGIEIITAEEKRQVLFIFNDTGAGYPKDKTIHCLFEEQVEKTPDHIAIIGHGGTQTNTDNNTPMALTYRELHEKSNRLAYVLKEKGVQPDSIAGLMVEPLLELIIGIFAIIKAGGAYLPLEPDLPAKRINYMLKDSCSILLLTTRRTAAEEVFNGPIVTFESSAENREVSNSLKAISGPANILYSIYTSGTTGKSKGVLIENKNIANYFSWFIKKTKLTTDDRALLTSSFGFDLGYSALYPPILNGDQVHIIPRATYLSSENLIEYIVSQGITYLKITPSLFRAIVESSEFTKENCRKLRLILLGGEEIKIKDLEKTHALGPHIEFINHYGPTEATIGCVAQKIDFDLFEQYKAKPTIGRPIDNMKVFILDKVLAMVPLGLPGELCVCGEGVGRGYLNQPELTAEKFDHEFWYYQDHKDEKNFLLKWTGKKKHLPTHPLTYSTIYRTGDMARWTGEGLIEFLGRIDSQLKIRGYRVEIGEIENTLLKHETIKEAAVIHWKSLAGEVSLCAYIVWKEDKIMEKRSVWLELKEFLSCKLPDYMIPSNFVQVENIPMTPNGKINRKMLPTPEIKVGSNYVAPRDKLEEKLTRIWAGVLVLEIEKIGIDDNFFHLGGHSLKATILVSRIHKELNVKVPLTKIFNTPSIREMARFIKDAEEYKFLSLAEAEKKEYYSLSSAQMRLYILQQMVPEATEYNMPKIMILTGELERDKFEEAFKKLIERHESLRTTFIIVNTEPAQRIYNNVDFGIEYYDLAVNDTPGTGEQLQMAGNGDLEVENIINKFLRPFDLYQSPLLRIGLINTGKQHLLLMDMHHIISDGISNNILIRDFMTLYQGNVLPNLRIQYKDFTEWQKKPGQRELKKQQEEYWLTQFAGEIPVLTLPTDFVRPAFQSFEGKAVEFEIEKDVTLALKSLAYENGMTLYMILLSIYMIFLSKICTQEDIVVGSPVAGRRHADLENIIGIFINTLALHSFPRGEKACRKFLIEVKKLSQEGFSHQDYPYEDLVEAVAVLRDTSRNPLFDTMFVMHNIGVTDLEIPGVKLAPYNYETRISKFDLSLYGMETGEKLLFSLEYSTKLFKKETVERFVNYFKSTVFHILKNIDEKISGIEIITVEEKHRLLYDFNKTKTDYPQNKPLQQVFKEQVEQIPNHIAVVGLSVAASDESPLEISYRELNEKSNRLARVLIQKGVVADSIVAIIVERSLEMMIGIWGILKAGGAYLPLDPIYPTERIKYILKDSTTPIIVTSENPKNFIDEGYEVVEVGNNRLYRGESHNLETIGTSNHLAYVIYTSGSTGRPKGVMIQHRSVINFIKGITDIIDFNTNDAILSLTTLSFDIFGLETILPLTRGSKTIIGDNEDQLNAEAAAQAMAKNAVTILQVTPSRLLMLVSHETSSKYLKKLGTLLVGGEAFTGQLLEKTRALEVKKIYNMYGPTETTIWSAVKDVSVGEELNIGKPIANTFIYIVVPGKREALQPIGIAGELCISGDGLARGYVNRPELTAAKFIEWVTGAGDRCRWEQQFLYNKSFCGGPGGDFFKKSPLSFGDKIYKTGDLAKWHPDGCIEFLGRLDFQVKIRGFRIELGEIENRLLQHEEIEEAVVLTHETAKNGSQGEGNENQYRLHAYIVSVRIFTLPELREFLAMELPDYMIPSYFTQVEKIPLTPNGKVDRKSLETYITKIGTGVEYIAPRNNFEEEIANIWREELNLDKISIYENFFELGGNSLNIIRISNRLKDVTGKPISVISMFRYPTIHSLSQFVGHENMKASFSNERIEESVQMMEDTALILMEEEDE